jgi:ribosomal protein S18 acetylase RimI-like enzyme
MIGTPSQYSKTKLVGLHSPTSLKRGEYFANISEDGKIVASLYVLKRDGYIIRDVFVLPEYRGRGYGYQLIQMIIKHLKPKGMSIHLYVDPTNKDAISLYKKSGFVLKGPGIHGDSYFLAT